MTRLTHMPINEKIKTLEENIQTLTDNSHPLEKQVDCYKKAMDLATTIQTELATLSDSIKVHAQTP